MNIKLPTHVCSDCGNKAIEGTDAKVNELVWIHKDKCDICKKETEVCHVRNYGYKYFMGYKYSQEL